MQTLGGVDDSLYAGEIQYAPVYKHWYYEVVMTELRINRHKIDVPCKEVGVNILVQHCCL